MIRRTSDQHRISSPCAIRRAELAATKCLPRARAHFIANPKKGRGLAMTTYRSRISMISAAALCFAFASGCTDGDADSYYRSKLR
jgi:hypothetical protein